VRGAKAFIVQRGMGLIHPQRKCFIFSWFKGFIAKLQDIMGTLLWNNKKQAYSVCGRNANG